MNISNAEAHLELALLDSKAQQLDRLDVFARFTNAGLPPEIILRLEELWETTKHVGNNIIRIGRIIIMEIMRFVKENPNLAIGVALGAAVGAITSLIPYLGQFLAPLSIAIGAAIGGVAGSRLDRGQKPGKGIVGISQEVIALAHKFFELFAAIFIALKNEITSSAEG